MLEILYQDEYIIAINKPSGLLVHKSFYARDAKVYAIQELRNQIGQALWDFYQFQQHKLRAMHADPHPGNFIITNYINPLPILSL